MSDHDALLATVILHPAEDTPRQVYADWLDDRGLPGDAERGEFIRVQVELATWAGNPDDKTNYLELAESGKDISQIQMLYDIHNSNQLNRRADLRRRERELLEAHHFDWFPVRQNRYHIRVEPPRVMHHLFVEGEGGNQVWCDFRRGFANKLECTAGFWLANADKLYWHSEQTSYCWCSRGGRYQGGKDCPACSGTGRIPCPFVATAQPISRVTLTTLPELREGRYADGTAMVALEGVDCVSHSIPVEGSNARGRTAGQLAKELCELEWKGITFSLPPEPIVGRLIRIDYGSGQDSTAINVSDALDYAALALPRRPNRRRAPQSRTRFPRPT